jgi:hypothetical protein
LNWIDRIKELTNKQDKSPELKRGEIKHILIKTVSVILPDFDFYAYRNGCYLFLRQRELNSLQVYEILHVMFTLKDRNFTCSITSTINLERIFSNAYNTGLLNPHYNLKVLKYNSGVLNIR